MSRGIPDRFKERSSTSQNTNTEVNHRSSSPDARPSASQADNSSQWGTFHNSDYYYVRNQLHSFSFGTAPRLSNSPPTRTVALSQDDSELEDMLQRADITPRPSVVAYDRHSPPRNHAWQRPSSGSSASLSDIIPDTFNSHQTAFRHGRVANLRISPVSSASGSVLSLSIHDSRTSLYTGSDISIQSSTAPRTPSNEFTSSDDDEDRHRSFYIDADGPYPSSSANASTTSMEFSSEEEYESDFAGADIEISSARMGSVEMNNQELDRIIYGPGGNDHRGFEFSQERRGSLPMVIPGVITSQNLATQYALARDREDSIASLRRPSRSLDDDLRITDAIGGPSIIARARSDGPSVSQVEKRKEEGVPLTRDNAEGRAGAFLLPSYTGGASQRVPAPTTSSSATNVLGDFDLDWADLRHGIVSFDPSQDIVRLPGNAVRSRPPANPRWFDRFGVGGSQTSETARRPSIATISSLGSDTFGRAIGKWGGEGYKAQRKDWTFKREREDRALRQSPSASGIVAARGFAGLLGSKSGDEERKKSSRERGKEKERLAKAAASWKGMRIDSQEIWSMDLIGRFRVERKATKTVDISKGPQQRIIVHHISDTDTPSSWAASGPASTIHKHSKAVAFSIGRFYRKKNEIKEKREAGTGPLITASHPPAPLPESQKRPGSMILLAPRKVQVAFTNTTSTRRLESHGLLDEEQPSTGAKDKERDRKGKDDNGKDREKERKDKDKDKERVKEKQQGQPKSGDREGKKAKEQKDKERPAMTNPSTILSSGTVGATPLLEVSKFANSSSSSAETYQASTLGRSSTIVASSSVPPTPLLSPASDISAHYSQFDSLFAPDQPTTPTVANSPSVRNVSRRRRRRVHDPLEMDEDDDEYDDDDGDSYGRYSPPTRTPHSEAYGTVDASLIEQLNLERAQYEQETNSVFRKLFRGRNNRTPVGPVTGQLEANYVPPWIVLPSRSRQEQQQRVVENLNSSFMDVGLLPSAHRAKSRASSTHSKKRDDLSTNILGEVPEESLYMLLPLWPGETDPIAAQKHLHLDKRIPPADQRQYLLLFYKSQKTQKSSKKRSRVSPSRDGERTDRSILLNSFHISARFVAHNELIGTGIRVPDDGLSICGPLDYAWETLPSPEIREECKSDWVIIGICHSREGGVEFVPDGIAKMGLCLMSSKPPSAVNDKYIPSEPSLQLTPVGRAVLEMVWLGSIALTSFGQV
ncbi:hypothetical protein AX17_003976 [Amanita inopinata Kibby_2008]|nr:hypothetical protein AX17_003976 [Amanita inopinata Kibby_2008]